MLTFLAHLLLGNAARAAEVVLDHEARTVLLDRWRLDWRAEAPRLGHHPSRSLG